jgi:alpha-L-fucosidase
MKRPLSLLEEVPDNILPKPTPAQLAWQDAELGLIYHYDLHIFDDIRYNQHHNRQTHFKDPNIFNPRELDTDQWVEAAKQAGARFAIITASHETGFRLWQSDVNPYCLKAIKWGNGKRDIVGEFVESCRKVGIKPGVYLGARWNSQLGIWDFKVTRRSPLSQSQYNRLIEQEVEEICTRYGELFELWFDGGILSPDEGGPDVLPIFEKHQPNCLFYHSDQRRDARWGGTETGTVGYPCWATVNLEEIRTGRWNERVKHLLMHGDPQGKDWCPAMSDAPLRNHEWFWEPGDEGKIYPLDALVEMYYKSVGRNSTLILGVTPDSRGLVPEADMRRLREFGDEIRRRFGKAVAETNGGGETLELSLPTPSVVDHVIIMEDITRGERVRGYLVEGLVARNRWRRLCEGSCIGHKRIERFKPVEVAGLRLRIIRSVAPPIIRKLAAFNSRLISST